MWINQFLWCEVCTAFVALIAVGSFVAAMRTRSYYIFVCQKLILLRVIVLFRSLLYELSFVIKLAEEVRCKLMMRIACGAGIYIKRNAKVLERLLDDAMIAIHYILSGATFLTCTDGYRYTMFVTSANKQHLLTTQTKVSDIHIGRYIDTSQVSDVNRTISVRKSYRYCSSLEILILIHIDILILKFINTKKTSFR